MNIMDIVALAKAGYKKDDVKELIDLSKSLETEETKHAETSDELQKLQAELEQTKTALAEAQQKNVQTDNGVQNTKKDYLSELDKLFK